MQESIKYGIAVMQQELVGKHLFIGVLSSSLSCLLDTFNKCLFWFIQHFWLWVITHNYLSKIYQEDKNIVFKFMLS